MTLFDHMEERPAEDLRVERAPDPPPVAPVPPTLPQATTMQSTALVFLEEPLARRLAVAWQSCGGNESTWMEAAGISIGDVATAKRIAVALKVNGICRTGGVTDPLALNYIAAIAAEPLQRAARRNGTGKQ